MKILQINSHYDQGGAAKIVACIHRQLLADGQESYVAYGRGGIPEEKNLYRFNKVPEIYFSALVSRVVGINGWSNRRATKRLLTFIDKVKPDVIHMHALHGYYLNFRMLFDYINKHNIPCVWTFHDCHAFVGNCGYFFECRRWQQGCGRCPHIRNYPISQFFDFTAFMWKHKKEYFTAGDNKVIVTPSAWLTGEAKKSFFGKYKCITINNGIDAHRTFYPREKQFCREKYGYGADEKIILGIAVGYSDPRKGAKYMLQLARELDSAKMILVGWNHCNDKLLEGISNVVTLPAISDANILAEYYSLADVFVLTSLAENYATVNLEAMACGTPVVGFDNGGTPEQLAEGKGIVVPTGNQEALNQAVQQVLNGEVSLLAGVELADKIREENSLEKMARKYQEIYAELKGTDYEKDIRMYGHL